MDSIKNPAVFLKKKETKGTFVFEEMGDLPIFGTLYMKKYAAKELGIGDTFTLEVKKA
jgi:hypothetical protein